MRRGNLGILTLRLGVLARLVATTLDGNASGLGNNAAQNIPDADVTIALLGACQLLCSETDVQVTQRPTVAQ